MVVLLLERAICSRDKFLSEIGDMSSGKHHSCRFSLSSCPKKKNEAEAKSLKGGERLFHRAIDKNFNSICLI